ncbi:MAG: hypothetical protein RL846_03665, partial [Deltaproteobacteria bacterium]
PPPAAEPAPEAPPAGSNGLVWALIALCLIAGIALAVVWQLRRSQEDPVFLLNPTKSAPTPTKTATTS